MTRHDGRVEGLPEDLTDDDTAAAARTAGLRALVRSTPAQCTVKGMFVESVLSVAERAGARRPTQRRYLAFKDYPLTELMYLMLECTGAAFPSLTPEDGLRRLGALGFLTFAESLAGKVLFSFAGGDWKAALRLTPKAYELSLRPGRAELVELGAASARIELRQVYNFGATYQVGVFEGAMQHYGVQGSVVAIARGPGDTDIHIEWT